MSVVEHDRPGDPPDEVMDEPTARGIAHASHLDARDRHGELVIEHVARVASSVPPEARVVAWLHDVPERTPVTLRRLLDQGLDATEAEAITLLTREAGESFELNTLRIAFAPGTPGRLARAVKLADLDDHLARRGSCADPPYRWARRHIEACALRDRASLPAQAPA